MRPPKQTERIDIRIYSYMVRIRLAVQTGRTNIWILADYPALPGYLLIPRSIVAVDISVVTEPLPSYQQLLIAGFRGYESCTRCLAMNRLEHTYIYPFFLRYFGPFGRMPHFSLLILFLILIQSGKGGKWNYTIHRKIVMANIHTYKLWHVVPVNTSCLPSFRSVCC
jgi:hypothetical protein